MVQRTAPNSAWVVEQGQSGATSILIRVILEEGHLLCDPTWQHHIVGVHPHDQFPLREVHGMLCSETGTHVPCMMDDPETWVVARGQDRRTFVGAGIIHRNDLQDGVGLCKNTGKALLQKRGLVVDRYDDGDGHDDLALNAAEHLSESGMHDRSMEVRCPERTYTIPLLKVGRTCCVLFDPVPKLLR